MLKMYHIEKKKVQTGTNEEDFQTLKFFFPIFGFRTHTDRHWEKIFTVTENIQA